MTSHVPGAAIVKSTDAFRLVAETNTVGVPAMSDCAGLWMRTVAPETKCEPVIVRRTLPPFVAAVGLTEFTVGPVLMVRQAHVLFPPSAFVTVTSRAPVAAPEETAKVAVIVVALTKAGELTVTPVPETEAVMPLTNPVPEMVTLCDAPWPSADGLRLVAMGAALTEKHPVHVATSVPGTGPLSTITLCAPSVAVGEIVTLTVMLVEPFTVCEFFAIPVPEKVTVAVGRKLLPFTVILTAVAPRPKAFGATVETE
jgi:hypothetical protein